MRGSSIGLATSIFIVCLACSQLQSNKGGDSTPLLSGCILGAIMSCVFAFKILRTYRQQRKAAPHIPTNSRLELELLVKQKLQPSGQENTNGANSQQPAKSTYVVNESALANDQREKRPPSKSWLERNFHILMFASLAIPIALVHLEIVFLGIFFGRMGMAPAFFITMASMPAYVIVVSLAMMPFGYNSKRTFGVFELLLFTTAVAIVARLLTTGRVSINDLRIEFVLMLYPLIMAVYGLAYLIRVMLRNYVTLPQLPWTGSGK